MVLQTYSSDLVNAAISNSHVVRSSTSANTKAVTNVKDDIKKTTEIDSVKAKQHVETYERTNLRNTKVNYIEEKVSAYQEYDSVLSEDEKVLNKVKDSLNNYIKSDNKSNGEINAVTIELKDAIKKVDENAKNVSNSTKNIVSSNLGRIFDSESFENIKDLDKNYKLSDVIVGGENYLSNRSFDISTPAGSSAALSVIEGAIVKIASFRQKVQSNINELMQYPEILELDRAEYQDQQSKIRSANTAQILVNKLKASVRLQINEVQNSQKVEKISDVITLLSEV